MEMCVPTHSYCFVRVGAGGMFINIRLKLTHVHSASALYWWTLIELYCTVRAIRCEEVSIVLYI